MIDFLRFPVKLTFSLLLSLILSLYLDFGTSRWALITTTIVVGSVAFDTGGNPYSGTLRYRSILRIIGTIIGCIAAFVIIIFTVRAPVVMLLLCCLCVGSSIWLASLIKVENVYALSLAGYTVLIIVISANSTGNLTVAPQFVVDRCNEILLGIGSAMFSDRIFATRSMKKFVHQEIDDLLVKHCRLFQLYFIDNKNKKKIKAAWYSLACRTISLNDRRSQLMMECIRWKITSRRLKMLNVLSLTLLTHLAENFSNQNNYYVSSFFYTLCTKKVNNINDAQKYIKLMYKMISIKRNTMPQIITSWFNTIIKYLFFIGKLKNNSSINPLEKSILDNIVILETRCLESRHIMINSLYAFLIVALSLIFWLYTGWKAGGGFVVMLAVVITLAMCMPNPIMIAKDFLYGMVLSIPLSMLYFCYLLPATQQSIFLLFIAIGILGFIGGIFIQCRQIGTLGSLIGMINSLGLSNPMKFKFNVFFNNAIGQCLGSCLAIVVIILICNKSKRFTDHQLVNSFMCITLMEMINYKMVNRENRLITLYKQLLLFIENFPRDLKKHYIALKFIIGYQYFYNVEMPINTDLSIYLYQIGCRINYITSTVNCKKRIYHFKVLLKMLILYQEQLRYHNATESAKAAVQYIVFILKKYQKNLI
ncbi:FUSC family protein [Candidatus Pantoea carbekii]|uniref:FUSC family protein n=1 Tax=Candidatus Pantoea carbekii TaxID=1235990 RepID=UPI00061878EB|nr:FUSC family protein [Candidatus Pantoea carbekii]AKC32511.1 p-hydroxybenzoic acid efflux pump subunit AaeB [Candidatus Pantoea carbekii]